MLHTHATPISNFLEEFINGEHHCCVDASVEAWTKVLRSEKFQDVFTKIVYMSCEKHLKGDDVAILTFADHFAPIALQIMISSLSLGTVAGVSTVYQASKELEEIIEEKLKSVEPILKGLLNSKPTFMKRGPKETI